MQPQIQQDQIFQAIANQQRLEAASNCLTDELMEAETDARDNAEYSPELIELRRRKTVAQKAEAAALTWLGRTQPQTLAGAAELVSYLRRDMEAGDQDWHLVAMCTLEAALKSFVAAPDQNKPDGPDHLACEGPLMRLDQALDVLKIMWDSAAHGSELQIQQVANAAILLEASMRREVNALREVLKLER